MMYIQRACESCIDSAMHLVSIKKLGIPQNSRDSFELLAENQIIDQQLKNRLTAMVGFRNIAVHNYQEINIKIIENIIEKHLPDFLEFRDVMIKQMI